MLGDLGAGKTCFSRGFIRLLSRDPELIVTSPTYLLDNTYTIEHPDVLNSIEDLDEDNQSSLCELHHMDLYRLPTGKPIIFEPLKFQSTFLRLGCDVTMLNIPEIYSSSICLIEWPQRLAKTFYPKTYLDISIRIDAMDGRRILQMSPMGERWVVRLRQFSEEFVRFSEDGTAQLHIE